MGGALSPERAMLVALVLPAFGALLIALTGRWRNVREGVTLATSAALLLTVGSLLPHVLAGERPALTLLEMIPGIALHFELEPLGMIFAGVAALLWPVNSLYSIGYMRANREGHQTRFYVCFALALASSMGIALSGNLLTLFVFYEALTLSTYPLVTHAGNAAAMRAGRVYLGILVSTSIGLLLPAIVWTWTAAGTLDFEPGGILAGSVAGGATGVLLALYVFGIGKAALMPFHRWLPAAMVAPTPVSALLHAVAVVKAGVFTVVKVLVYVFGAELLLAEPSTGWLTWAAGFTVLVASVVALGVLREGGNLKRLLAYSTVSQLSYIVMAAANVGPASWVGASLHIAAHAFGKITLFFAAGSIYTAAHKTDIAQLDGIGRRMPWTMGAFTLAALSMIGLPPAAGFVSKWYMLMGSFQTRDLFVAGVLVVSTLLNAAYFVPIVHAAFFRSPPEGDDHGEAPWPVVVALVTTAVLTSLFFFFPGIPLGLARHVGGGGP